MKINHCNFPEDILYDIENFVWSKTNAGERIVTIGIISCLGYISGKLSNINLKPVGVAVERGKSLGTIESPRYFGVLCHHKADRVRWRFWRFQEILQEPKHISSRRYLGAIKAETLSSSGSGRTETYSYVRKLTSAHHEGGNHTARLLYRGP